MGAEHTAEFVSFQKIQEASMLLSSSSGAVLVEQLRVSSGALMTMSIHGSVPSKLGCPLHVKV